MIPATVRTSNFKPHEYELFKQNKNETISNIVLTF